MLEEEPEIEEKIFKVKGLMSELLTFKKKKTKFSFRKRKNSMTLGNDDTNQRKKVRFNISSTIYEDSSALRDDSVSIIEPLSIYSNVSPPQELVDVSFPRYAYSLTENLGRGPQNSTASQTQQSLTDAERENRRVNENRPLSAGRARNFRRP